MKKEELNKKRIDGMVEEILEEAKNGEIHHQTLKSIAKAYRWSYGVGAIYAKRHDIKII